MNHKINLDIARLDAYYENMMDEVYLEHHTYPTYITRKKWYPDDPDDPGLYAGDISAYAGY